MDRVSDEQLETLIGWEKSHPQSPATLSALTELRERREAEKDYRKALDAASIEIMRGYADVNAGKTT